MIRRLLTVLLTAAISLSCISGIAACDKNKTPQDDPPREDVPPYEDDPPREDDPDGFDYTEYTENGVTVGYTVTGVETEETEISIPSMHNGLPVVAVGEEAFSGLETLTAVVIPDSVKKIGGKAFYECSSLVGVTVGSGVVLSGGYAFGRCESLKRVDITDLGKWCCVDFADPAANPLYFADELYINGKLATDLVIPDTAELISDYAFYGLAGLKSVTTGNGVTSVGNGAFTDCVELESVVIGNKVTSIGDMAFSGCTGLNELTLGNGLKTIGDYAFAYCSLITTLTVPSGVLSIGECAFVDCSGLKDINFSYGLETIGACAFGGCIGIESFVMPDSVYEIGVGMLMFSAGGGFGGGVIPNNMKEIIISGSITEIPDFAFNGCYMTDVIIGNNVQTIRYSSFYACINLKNVVIPKSVVKIESYAFYTCPSLEYVFYGGNLEDWTKINIGKNGNEITSATVCFYSEVRPALAGNFWHYVDGVPALW